MTALFSTRRLLVSVALLLAVGLYATPSVAQHDTRVGLGVGLTSSIGTGSFDVSTSPVSIYVPIQLEGFRLEPQVGLFRRSQSNGDVENTLTLLEIGTGAFATRTNGDARLHYGGRIGLQHISTSESFNNNDESDLATNVFVGPAIGGEYVFDETVSLGAEGRLLYVNEGTPDDSDLSAWRLQTGGSVFVRVYF